MTKLIAIALPTLFAIPVLVWLSGGMFGQRCERAFPGNAAEQERCVYEISKGLRNYPSESRP